MQLRDYQQACSDVIWNSLVGDNRVLAVLATGAGKTEIFIDFVARASVRTVVLVGRDKLVEQTARRMRAAIFDVGVWSAGQGEKRIAPCTVVSVHSADNLNIEGLKLIVVDEAHNLTEEGRYAGFIARHPGAKVVGFTATPWNKGIEIYGEHAFFPRIHFKKGLKSLVDEGYLVRPISKAMPLAFDTGGLTVKGDDFDSKELERLTSDRSKIKAQIADAIPRLEGRRKVVWICTSIDHATNVAEELGLVGETASIVHSKNIQNDFAMECFERGDVRHMVSVMMLTEGYDYAHIDAIVLKRPTRSPTLYVQTVGRGLRPVYDTQDLGTVDKRLASIARSAKPNCLVLDYGEVVKNCGPIHDPITRTARKTATKSEPILVTVKVCPKCLSYVAAELQSCPDCGHEMKVERDLTKSLKREASEADLLGARAPETLACKSVSIARHRSKKGNDCVVLEFECENRIWPVKMYGSAHPFSWRKFSAILNELTPFRFDSWQECFNAIETHEIVLEPPSAVIVKMENGFEAVQGIENRARDSDFSF